MTSAGSKPCRRHTSMTMPLSEYGDSFTLRAAGGSTWGGERNALPWISVCDGMLLPSADFATRRPPFAADMCQTLVGQVFNPFD